ncbi:MAG: Uncharacterized protein AUK63_1155 [bacterium P3]|nr:MAG: Uncharacterized protein AUK63_1155 [bacterium P3]KWW40320.1 MAG: Uncharacterized protein F083_1702 [bacterium F083]
MTSIKEEGLRRRIGSDYLIGCYTINDDGTACFTDIRGGEGDIVRNPKNEQSDIIIKCDDMTLEEGVFYHFQWKLSESEEIVMVGHAEPVNNVQFLNALFEARLKLSGKNLETFNSVQKTIFNEVTGAKQTYIYELLQNANDYPFNNEHVYVQFRVTDHYLFFLHSGAYFNLKNIVGISDVNQGEKAKNTQTIGYKGIGFKTVFSNNEYVYLRSGDWSLRFDRKYSEEKFYGRCPWALMPIPTNFSELDEEAKATLQAASDEMRVQFALRHKVDAKENIPQLDKVFSNNQILLFIPNVYKVEVFVDNKKTHVVEKDDEKWIVDDYQTLISDDLKEWIVRSIENGERVPEKFKDISKVRMSFAVSKEGKKIIPVEDARVYNYLPTELRLGFKFLFNADFIPDGSRSGLHNVRWNDYVMEQCGSTFAKWWKSLLVQDDEDAAYDIESVFDILPNIENNSNYGKLFLKGFLQQIKEISCIPVIQDGKYELVKMNDVILDDSGIIASEHPIFTEEEFYLFTRFKGTLPHKGIRCHTRLNSLLKHFNISKVFNGRHLTDLCENHHFIEWLKNKDNSIKFLGFLVEHGYIDNFWNYPIFLRNNGSLGRADNTYYDIDKYVDDLSFLANDLPRLDQQVRDTLTEKHREWASYSRRFKPFMAYEFARNIFMQFNNFRKKFMSKENSSHFLHFLALTQYSDGIPENYPLCMNDGEILSGNHSVYQESDEALAFAAHSWVDKSWIHFIHNEYFVRDAETVKAYLSSRCGIKPLTTNDCYKSFIANDKLVGKISDRIKTADSSKDFYLYLSDIQDEIGNFTPTMRQSYTLLSTDSKNEDWLPITRTIFWDDDEWCEMTAQPWMPDNCCMAISDIYFNGVGEEMAKKLKSLFTTKQVVQKYSVQSFYQNCLRNRLKDVFVGIRTKEMSIEFMNFIYSNKTSLFRDGVVTREFKDMPILLRGTNQLVSISNVDESIYISCPEIDNLYNQKWFVKDSIAICDESYTELFDGRERKDFFNQWGIKDYQEIEFVRSVILKGLNKYVCNLEERDANIAFHRYFSDVHESLSEKDLEPIKDMPIFISSPEDERGILSNRSSNHYLPSDQLTQIISLDLVPISILDSIHPDYIKKESDQRYFLDKLDNVKLELDEFVEYINGESESVDPYLREESRNIRFWQWACSISENRKALRCFPMLGRKKGDATDSFEMPENLYTSNDYAGYDIEDTINEYVTDALFVSPRYAQGLPENVKYNWKSLFRDLKITVDDKEIVYKDILPNLSRYKKTSIISSLAQCADDIISKLRNKDKEMTGWINNLQLLCVDGNYKTPKNCIISGQYFDFSDGIFTDIKIPNLVSEQYIEDCKDNDDLRRKVVKFITSIADIYEINVDSQTKLRDSKLVFFIQNQQLYKNNESHYRIISQLAEAFNSDVVGISALISKTGPIYLHTVNGLFKRSSELYLSSVYNPSCDYMAYGVSELDFVSEKYSDYTEQLLNRFFRLLSVRDSFSSYNLPQLANERFAKYFWEIFAPKNEFILKDICTEDNLRTIPCIPSNLGVRRPCDLYDHRNSLLKKMVLRIKGGEDKLSSIELPSWLSNTRLGFRGRLYLPDCLSYLNLNIIDFRRDVIDWITDIESDTLRRYSNAINDYIANALWFNGEKQWVPLKGLYALEWGNKTLKDNFSGNARICNPSYMPESKIDYDKLCSIFNIRILTDNDFSKRKDGHFFRDEEAIREIRKRLLYLAYKTGKDNWKESFDEYNSRLQAADISQCERIAYSFSDDIETDLLVYAEDDKALWYVGAWTGSMFLDILGWIESKIGIKGNFDNNFMRKLFLTPFKDFVKRQEGGSLPQEILDFLSEEEKAGINVDKFTNAEKFEEKSYDEVESDIDGVDDIEDSDIDSDEQEELGSSFHSTAPTGSRASRSSSPRESSQKPSNRSNGSSTKPSAGSTNTKEPDTPQLPQKTTEEKLKEEFEMKAQRKVGRPASSGYSPELSEVSIRNAHDDSISKPFFDTDDNTPNIPSNDSRSSALSKASQTINRKNTEAQNMAEHAAEQVDIFELWDNTPRYSYLWYKYLMKLQNEDKAKASRRSTQIDFEHFELICDDKVLHLSVPSVIVPGWIEDASVAMQAIGAGAKKINGSIVKVDDTEVDVMINPDDIAKLQGAKKIRLNAESLTNIIDSLETRFLQLGYDDSYDMQANLPSDISFIYGPPGTGKTTRLVERLHEIVSGSESKMNILVLTPTNKAADVIAEKLACDDDCYNCLARFGSTECMSLIEEYAVLQTRDTIDMELLPKNIVVTTAARFAYDFLQPDDVAICDYNWDYVVVDEASMIDLLTITYVLHKAKGCKFIIAGDPKQIQPINEVLPMNVYGLVGLDSFKDAIQNYKRYPVEALTVQHRSVPTIGNLVSKFAYDGLVENDAKRLPQKPLDLDGIPVKDINFIGFKTEDFGDYLYSLTSIDKSAFHLYSAIFTYNMADYVVKQVTKKYPDKNYKIGIISPYKAEANAVGQMLERRPIDTDVATVTSGTVHRFQGDECDIMFIILNPPSNVTSGAHVVDTNIINVAMSRARDYIFFVIPDSKIQGFHTRETLGKLVDNSDKTIQYCFNIEKTMFGNSQYIYDNTNVTPHLPVNVYYDTHSLYEVRVDESTLDIQINDDEKSNN